MTQKYIRTAEAIGEAIGAVFPPLPACLLRAPNRLALSVPNRLANRPNDPQAFVFTVEAPGIEPRRNGENWWNSRQKAPSSSPDWSEICPKWQASGQSFGQSRGGMAGIRKALMDALRLLTFKGGGVSPTKAEAVRLLVQVVEVLDGERGEVAMHQPSAIFRSPREGERRTMITALKRCSWNQSEAARQLGLNRMTFGDRCKALQIEVPARAKIREVHVRGTRSRDASAPWSQERCCSCSRIESTHS
jgi:hypothetical protein